MNQQKRGQQSHGAPDQSRSKQEKMHGDRSQPNREPTEGSRENVNLDGDIDADRDKKQRDERGSGGNERGMGGSRERNAGGISNRGMDPSEEQEDLPGRGSTRESER